MFMDHLEMPHRYITCTKCSIIFDKEEYVDCPRCQEQRDFENGPWKGKREC